jgi:hypothetical protein
MKGQKNIKKDVIIPKIEYKPKTKLVIFDSFV